MPTTARRRLKQSVALARQLLATKKAAASSEESRRQQEATISKLQQDLADAHRQLEQTAQPYAYLIESMRKVCGWFGIE